ncbi:MAG: hypothetical protein JSS74_05240, partial [Actinobacteria bacterium]|nr:hypothetical protein [Actinomycetota bacterium]
MSTSDQPQHVADQSSGGHQLTRKQMREARLTGSTPIVTPEEAESARQAAYSAPVAQNPSVAAPVVPEPVVVPEPQPEEKLTRRQKREQDQARTGSLFIDDATAAPAAPLPAATPFVPAAAAPAPVVPAPVVPAESTPPAAPASSAAMITDVPRPAQQTRRRGWDGDDAASAGFAGEQDGVDDTIRTVQPVASAAVTRAEEETGRAWHAELPATDPVRPAVPTTPAAELAREIPAPATVPPALPVPQPVLPVQPVPQQVIPQTEETPTLEGLLAGVADAAPAPRGTVNAAFGQKVLAEQPQAPKT